MDKAGFSDYTPDSQLNWELSLEHTVPWYFKGMLWRLGGVYPVETGGVWPWHFGKCIYGGPIPWIIPHLKFHW